MKALLPQLKEWIPAGIDISILTDRTTTIRASVHDMQFTLGLTILLVMSRRVRFSPAPDADDRGRDNGAAVACRHVRRDVGRRVFDQQSHADGARRCRRLRRRRCDRDDRERLSQHGSGHEADAAALAGSQQIGFTVISISVSLIAAFIPVLFMSGIVGRLLHEFALTLTFAIAISAVVSLTVTPMICAHFIKRRRRGARNLADRIFEGALGLVVGAMRSRSELRFAISWSCSRSSSRRSC